MKTNSKTAGQAPTPVTNARRFAEHAEAAIAELEKRLSTIGPLEKALAERIRTALARLLECAEQLAADGLMVRGSTGQRRPHQLLKVEQELRHEITGGLEKLVFRAEQRAMFVRAQALTRKGGERR